MYLTESAVVSKPLLGSLVLYSRCSRTRCVTFFASSLVWFSCLVGERWRGIRPPVGAHLAETNVQTGLCESFSWFRKSVFFSERLGVSRHFFDNDSGIIGKISSVRYWSRTFDPPISRSDTLPLSYRGLVRATLAIELGSLWQFPCYTARTRLEFLQNQYKSSTTELLQAPIGCSIIIIIIISFI